MSNTTTKVLAGCGVGCLLFVVAIAGLGWMGYRWARTAVEVVENAERTERRLEADFGSTRDYRPPIGGRPAEDRLQAFVVVRERTAEQRRALAESVESMAPAEGEGRVIGGLRAAKAGIDMAPRILELINARNEALLEVGMGIGEYTWIYWLAFHAWLGHPTGDSLFDEIMEVRSASEGSVRMHIDGMDPEELTRELRLDIEAMLRSLEEGLAAEPERIELKKLVTAELEAMAADRKRMPWQEGLPEEFTAGLGPYRNRLEETYSTATNPFELLEIDAGPHSLTVE
jgi:hypothetical protein